MDLLRPIRAYDRFQQRHAPLAIPMAVLRKFGHDQAGNLAALVAYYAFFSLFPLLLVFVTILGYVLQGHPHAQQAVEHSILGQFPIIGAQIHPEALHGHVIALVIGLAAAIWSGLGVTQAAQNAFDRVWAVPFKDRPDFLRSRLHGLILLSSLGFLFIIATGASGLVSSGLGGTPLKVVGIVISLLLNVALFLLAFRLLTSRSIALRCLWLGVVVAAFFWEILQLVGGVYINHVLKHMNSAYAQFGFVIALLIWFHLGARLTLYAAEINVVVTRKLWPRSLLGPPEVAADQEALTALAKVEERHELEKIDVRFETKTKEPVP